MTRRRSSRPLHKAQAVIEFNMDGKIVTADKNFLDVLGYTLEEIQGKHHRMFVDPNRDWHCGVSRILGKVKSGRVSGS